MSVTQNSLNQTTITQATSDNSTNIASTAYVTTAISNAIAGVNPAIAVQAATTSASDTSALTYNNGVSGIGATLTGANNTAVTFDGFTFTAIGQRGLVKNDTQSPSGAFNGVYYVTQVQASLLPLVLIRALDYDQSSDINNTGAIPVVNGTTNALTSWLLTSSVTTVGTDPLTYSKFSVNPASVGQSVGYNPQTTTYAPVSSDLAKIVDFTGSSNATWTMTSAATLGANWFCYLRNSGTSNAQLTLKSSSGTIDGVVAASGYIMYAGETRLIQSDGTNFRTIILNGGSAVFTASGTWTRPAGYTAFQFEIISGGGAGGSRTTTGDAGGGGGGGIARTILPASSFVAIGSTETVTVGGTANGVTSNANGTAGNNSSLTVNGSAVIVTGGGGGLNTASAGVSGGAGGSPPTFFGESVTGANGGACNGSDIPQAVTANGGPGGGGAGSNTAGGTRTGGTAFYGGAGGTGSSTTGTGTTGGTIPGGGGGGSVQNTGSGSGARGQIIVRGII